MYSGKLLISYSEKRSRNNVSAANSRLKRKQRETDALEQNEELKNENVELKIRNASVEIENSCLKEENEFYKQILRFSNFSNVLQPDNDIDVFVNFDSEIDN